MKKYKVVCLCNAELEVEENNFAICPDCGLVYDDLGNILGREDV